MTDEEIDVSDSPPLDASFFENAEWRMPAGKRTVILSLDAEVLTWFEEQGADFQERIAAALRDYADAHRV